MTHNLNIADKRGDAMKILCAIDGWVMWWGLDGRDETVFQCLRPGVTPRSVAGECSKLAAWSNRI